MTTYDTDKVTSNHGRDADDRGPASGEYTDPLTKEKLKELDLEQTIAYIRVKSKVPEVSYATSKKREQRKKRSDNDLGDYIVSVNKKDKEARRAIKAVADAILADENKNVISAVTSLISDARLFELLEILFVSKADVSLITEMARRGDLTTLATINAKCPKLLQAVLTLVQSDDESMVALNGILRNASEASSRAKDVLNAAVAASQRPGDVIRYLEVNRRGGVRAQVLRWVLGGAN